MTSSPFIMRWLKRSFWCWYDHLWDLILLNLLWTLLNLPWLAAGCLVIAYGIDRIAAGQGALGLGALLVGLEVAFLSPPTLATTCVVRRYVEGRGARVADIVPYTRHHFVDAVVIGAVFVFVTAAMMFNISFYSRLAGPAGMIGAALAGVLVWMLALTGVTGLWVFQWLAWRGSVGFAAGLGAVKHSLYFALRHPVLGLSFLGANALFFSLGLVSGVGLFAGATMTSLLVTCCGFREMIGDGSSRGAPELGSGKGEGDSSGGYETRSLRELIRPWE